VIGALRSGYNSGCDYGDCAGGPSEVFVPFLLSLPIAVFACVRFHWVIHQVESFDLEMRIATLDLLNDLVRCRSVRK